MTTQNNNTSQAPNANDFIGGNYLKKEDLRGPAKVTIVEVRAESVLNGERRKLVVQFKEFEKALILNKTNIKRLTQMFGTSNTAAWRGPVTIYVETDVEFAGRVVGGIRLRPVKRVSEQPRHDRGQEVMPNGHGRLQEPEDSEVDYF